MYSLNVCNHLSFITTMVPIASCVMGFWSLKHCRRTRKKKKKEEIKTAAIFCINGFLPGSVGAAGGCSGYLTWIFQACSYALGSSALHFM